MSVCRNLLEIIAHNYPTKKYTNNAHNASNIGWGRRFQAKNRKNNAFGALLGEACKKVCKMQKQILKNKKIPYMFTLADNSLFYDNVKLHSEQDAFMKALYNEIDFTKWFSFGERMMGFNQWTILNEYERGVTHPLDKAHRDAVQLMLPNFKKIIGVK